MKFENRSFDELEQFLRQWRNFNGEGEYDFVGMFHLFRACTFNLMQHSLSADWDGVDDLLSPAEREFLRKLSKGEHPGA
jgi:hypothetical protein